MATTAYCALPFPLSSLPDADEDVMPSDLRDTALPLLRSAHCTLHAFSLTAARDYVALDDLAPALSVLAGQIEVCRNLVDHVTRDR